MVTRMVDLRSDTVTKPTEAMRAAMANAEVDDDVLGYDPTAFRLEVEMAKIAGKEAALFVPSGTMGNLISVLTHCEIRGSEVILGDGCHIHIYENGGISTIGGVHPRTVKNNEDGTMDIDLIEEAIRDPRMEICYPTTRLICLENSHAHSGGRCLSVDYTDKVGELAKKYGLKLHIDGARIFNASVALGVPVSRLVQAADSVSICLSKGLGAPAGSVIVGSKSFIARAKILRKTLGGGMRQVGVLCAAAYIALKENVGKLEGDHRKAKILAEGLNKIKGVKVDVASVETNIVYFDVLKDTNVTETKLCKMLEGHGVRAMPEGPQSIAIIESKIQNPKWRSGAYGNDGSRRRQDQELSCRRRRHPMRDSPATMRSGAFAAMAAHDDDDDEIRRRQDLKLSCRRGRDPKLSYRRQHELELSCCGGSRRHKFYKRLR